jgi:ubiquinone/menaquinone biosynthesis C-methylase UbiE
MTTDVKTSRFALVMAWITAGIFLSGWFLQLTGSWTGPIMGVWFVGTQRLRRGFLWMFAINVVPGLIFGWRKIPLTGPEQALHYLGWFLLVSVLGILPFTFHRFVSPRITGWLCTLPLPVGAVALSGIFRTLHVEGVPVVGLHTFIILWFAATIVWFWNRESRATSIVFGLGFILAGLLELTRSFHIAVLHATPLLNAILIDVCSSASLILVFWAITHPIKQRSWAMRPETVALLRSPFTGEPLQVVLENGKEALVSTSGERFPVRDGIPAFLKPEDLTGDNGKYNKLYENIGGFYDDAQRFFGAFKGVNLDSYFENYMNLLDVKPGDSVLETSSGTGLNFKYLPRGVKLSGLDLSAEMLANCQRNLRRWQLEGDLYLGNAESLPFADNSFDVVFTCGGFNFFSDRAKAVREMIRITKPGGHLMIEDETEEYVKSTYQNIPYTSSFYSDRKDAVKVPIDLVPTEMEDTRVEMLKEGKFYAITFRKPPAATCGGAAAFGMKNSDIAVKSSS